MAISRVRDGSFTVEEGQKGHLLRSLSTKTRGALCGMTSRKRTRFCALADDRYSRPVTAHALSALGVCFQKSVQTKTRKSEFAFRFLTALSQAHSLQTTLGQAEQSSEYPISL